MDMLTHPELDQSFAVARIQALAATAKILSSTIEVYIRDGGHDFLKLEEELIRVSGLIRAMTLPQPVVTSRT